MTTGMVRDQNLEKHIEKQMGCMTGFLHIFDRHHTLTGKRIYSSAKRLPPSAPPETDSSPEPEKSRAFPAESTPPTPSPERVTPSPTPETTQAANTPRPLPALEFKEGTRSSWKFSREAPRLSLDSRAVVDAKGSLHQRRSTSSSSVVARLMGLEPIPDSDPELRRSASESGVARDLPQYRFFDSKNFQLKQFQQQRSNSCNNNAASPVDDGLSNGRASDPKGFGVRNAAKTEHPRVRRRGIGQKKSFYDSADFFPEPTKHSVSSIYGEIERRLKMRGIDEPSKDLDTLKQILEALHLKGLLHSKAPTNHRNFVFDGTISGNESESPIVVMKPARSGRTGSDSPPPSSFWSSPRASRGDNNETFPTASPRRDRPESDRNMRAQPQARARNSSSPSRSESSVRSPNRMGKVTNMEMQRKVNDGVNPRKVAPVHSPKINSRRNNGPDQQVTSPSPRMKKASYHKEEKVTVVVAEDESSTVSESSFSTSSQTDTERLKVEEYNKEGRNLLERCDKLLNSLAELAAATELQQPSPVSVLDSSFYKDELSCSPSPVMKRCIDYKDQAAESEDEIWSGVLCSDESSEDCDFAYVSEILRASNYLPKDNDVFLLLEKQQYLKGNDTSKPSTLRRRLVFDTVQEILNRNRRLPPWKAASWAEKAPLLDWIWSEFRRIREREESEDLFEVICGVLRKDMAEDGLMKERGECPVEMGDVVLDIERLVFKDLIVETIRDLASYKGQCNKVSELRRKLVF